MMDTLIEQKRGFKKKYISYVIAGLLLTLAAGWLFFGNRTRRVHVDRNTLNIQPVMVGLFNDYMRVNGQVLPIRTVQLSVTEGGMVAEKIVEEGTMVKQGEVIVRLTNPMLNLSILDSEAQLAEKQNFLRNTLLDMEQNRLSLKKDQLQFDIEVGRQKRRFEQYKCLYDEKLVSREEYLQAQEEYELAFNRHNLVVESRKQDSIYRSVQVEQLEESLDNMRRNLVLVRQRGEDLNVKAPVSGQLGLLDVEIGQSIATGTRIGQINVLSDFKVEALLTSIISTVSGKGLMQLSSVRIRIMNYVSERYIRKYVTSSSGLTLCLKVNARITSVPDRHITSTCNWDNR